MTPSTLLSPLLTYCADLPGFSRHAIEVAETEQRIATVLSALTVQTELLFDANAQLNAMRKDRDALLARIAELEPLAECAAIMAVCGYFSRLRRPDAWLDHGSWDEYPELFACAGVDLRSFQHGTRFYAGSAPVPAAPSDGCDEALLDTMRELVDAEENLAEMTEIKDAAYFERNQVVAALAKCFPSIVTQTEIPGWSPEWHGCVYIQLPTGQVSWHFHESQMYLLDGIPTKGAGWDGWDGHDTEEKYRRLNVLQVPAAQAEAKVADDVDLWKFCRDALKRGAEIESQFSQQGYETFIAEIECAAKKEEKRLRAMLAAKAKGGVK